MEKTAAQAVALFRLVPQLANTTLGLLQEVAPESPFHHFVGPGKQCRPCTYADHLEKPNPVQHGLNRPPLCWPRAQLWEWIGVEKAAAQTVALFRLVPQLANTTLDLLQEVAPE